ncbi:MAG: aldo/keto reductase, partial [Sphaerochaetaceae bacterium]|nr:aldo/keto reductase [Sphaerochaetaceae bacterium]
MNMVTLGSTGIKVNKNGFGALPIQRISKEDAAYLLKKAYNNGIRFFDTSRMYTDSEEKMGYALSDVRKDIIIATKVKVSNVEGFWRDLNKSLDTLKTDYIDIYQFHNPTFVPLLGDGTGLYEAMLEAKAQGKIRHIGITNHRIHLAKQAIESGLYETLQYPFSYLSGDQELELIELCKKNNMGFIAMKGLAGGLLTNSRACYAFMAQFDNVVPIWGVQREKELDEFLSYDKENLTLDDEMKAIIDADKKELVGEFCRACGYCMPCPMGIQINQCARMIQLIRRSPSDSLLNEENQQMMFKIRDCIRCGKCMRNCPYGLQIPNLLHKNFKDY